MALIKVKDVKISIHALREEGDRDANLQHSWHREFLSTPSARRATLSGDVTPHVPDRFLSTPSARRATQGSTTLVG